MDEKKDLKVESNEKANKEEKKFEQVKKADKDKIKKEKVQKVKKDKEKVKKEPKEKGKKSSIAIRIIAIIIILCLVIGLIYLALPSPARVLEQMLRDLKAGNFSNVAQYIDYKELSNLPVLGNKEDAENNAETSNIDEEEKLFYEDLQWNIKEIEKNGTEAKIETEITNKNYKTIFQNYTKKIIQKLFNNENPSTEEMEKALIEEFKDENVDKVTTTQTITVQKQDGKWKVVVDDNLKNAIYPGLAEAVEAIENLE